MAKLVSNTYAQALFELALENNSLDLIYDEVKAVEDVFAQNQELFKLLNHPKITGEEKIEVLKNIFSNRISKDMEGFLTLIVRKDRQAYFNDIFDVFISKVKEYKNIGICTVISASPIDEIKRKALVDKLIATTKYTSFEMTYKIDESLLAGMVIRIGDRIVDSSLKTKLDKLSKELYKIQLT